MRANRAVLGVCGVLVACWLIVTFAVVPVAAAPQVVGQDESAADLIADDDGVVAEPGLPEDGGPKKQIDSIDMTPVVLLVIGIVAVLGMIIGLKLNAFLALIISALIVSLGVGYFIEKPPQSAGSRMAAVVDAFGDSAAGIGIVIAMAAIIGKCMLDSGSADRIVRSAVKVTGERLAAFGLMVSGFVLAVPVFFDTVFYLLVPLARSLYQRTGRHYLRYLMAIATGGAITHTLVPPTPGPLLVAAILGVDIGMMMLVGSMVAVPAAMVGLLYSIVVDRKMPVEMRPLGVSEKTHAVLQEHQLPPLWIALLPVIIPVGLILAGTVSTTIADAEDRARLSVADIRDFPKLAATLREAEPATPAGRIVASPRLSDEDRQLLRSIAEEDAAKTEIVDLLNDVLLDVAMYDETAYSGVKISAVAEAKLKADKLRMKPVDIRRMNRVLLEDAFPELIEPHRWQSPRRSLADRLGLWSNPNFALMLAALVAMLTLKQVRKLTWRRLGDDVEESLMSGGVIILITAAGGAFGAMLTATEISETIKNSFAGWDTSGAGLLLLAFGVAAVLKVAQGSSTVAMIIGAGMMSAIIGDARPDYNLVYVATSVGAGSLMGSWMNDSGFWVFTKMGGLTEGESLRSWTPLLVILSLTSLAVTVLLSQVLPMRVDL